MLNSMRHEHSMRKVNKCVFTNLTAIFSLNMFKYLSKEN